MRIYNGKEFNIRCVICDVSLSDKEVSLDADLKTEPCTTCTQIIMDTAYADGFIPDDQIEFVFNDEDEEEVDEEFAAE